MVDFFVVAAAVLIVAAGAEVGLAAPSTNDSGPIWTLNVAPRKRTTRIKTRSVIARGLRMLERERELIFCKFIQ
jgi:hypothetical protein